MRVVVAIAVLQLMAAGCHGSDPLQAADGAAGAPTKDRDHDGLCDDTEAELGTNPDEIDSDGDGWPDFVEAIANTDPHDSGSPDPSQVGYLLLDPGTLELSVATTVDGNGEGATAQITARNAFDRHGRRASDYYRGATATGAEPPDNVRGIQPENGRFQSILGNTRLTFRLEFGFSHQETLDCAAALPFDFAVKGDVGGFLGTRGYLLVVSPKPPPLTARDLCLPVACI